MNNGSTSVNINKRRVFYSGSTNKLGVCTIIKVNKQASHFMLTKKYQIQGLKYTDV